MSGPKVLKIRENNLKYKKKMMEKYKGLSNWQFSDIIGNISGLNSILFKPSDCSS